MANVSITFSGLTVREAVLIGLAASEAAGTFVTENMTVEEKG